MKGDAVRIVSEGLSVYVNVREKLLTNIPPLSKTPPYRLIVWIGSGKRLHVFLKDTDLSLKRPYVSAHTY